MSKTSLLFLFNAESCPWGTGCKEGKGTVPKLSLELRCMFAPRLLNPKGEAREQEAWGAPVREGQQGSPQAVGQGPRGAGRQMTASSCRRRYRAHPLTGTRAGVDRQGRGPAGVLGTEEGSGVLACKHKAGTSWKLSWPGSDPLAVLRAAGPEAAGARTWSSQPCIQQLETERVGGAGAPCAPNCHALCVQEQGHTRVWLTGGSWRLLCPAGSRGNVLLCSQLRPPPCKVLVPSTALGQRDPAGTTPKESLWHQQS